VNWSWPTVIEWGIYVVIPAFLTGGVATAIIQGRFGKPLQRALTKKEEALASSATTDTSIELVKLWMESNRQLVESNARLEKSNEQIRKSNDRLQRDINETRQAMRSLVGIIERFMPLLRQTIGNEEEMALLNKALAHAKSLNGGLK
jgi:FtsZ-binding cell division protein ZapB